MKILLARLIPVLLLGACRADLDMSDDAQGSELHRRQPPPPPAPADMASAAPDMASAPGSALSIANGQTTNDATNVTYQFQYSGPVVYFHVFVDTDRNATTGYAVGGVGADYLIENGVLYNYSGTGGGWGWSTIGAVASASTAAGLAKYVVAFASLGISSPTGGTADLIYQVQGSTSDATLPAFTEVYSGTVPSPGSGPSRLPPLTSVSSPTIDKFELVASDGNTYTSGAQPYNMYNEWGGHQSRITHHMDGSIRLVYFNKDSSGNNQWRLMKKVGDGGAWAQEAAGLSTNDTYLLRNQVTDAVHVVSSPSTTAQSIYTSPSFARVDFPGAWPAQNGSRYGGAGIGPDGTICLKNYESDYAGYWTVGTYTDYQCANGSSGAWSWNPFVRHYIGFRHAYDYIFPGAQAGYSGYLSVSQRDTYYLDEGYTWMSASFGYVFNGLRFYKTGYASDSSYSSAYLSAPIPVSTSDAALPTKRPTDAYIDSQSRVFGTYYVDDPNNTSLNGQYVVVSDMNGGVLLDKRWGMLPSYGATRIVEDGSHKLWLIWMNEGSAMTQVSIYPLTVVTSPGFDLVAGPATDLSSTFAPYAIQGTLNFEAPRGGTFVSNYIEGMMVACGNTYPSAVSACYGSTAGSDKEKIFYFRLRLP